MISCPSVRKDVIRRHYDVATVFYRLLWGTHIHHGLWFADESIREAQVQLIDHLAQAATIADGDVVLDVGCGMGGSSIHLAKRYGCHVTGVTVSGLQRRWAALAAGSRLRGHVQFQHADAESLELPPDSLDVVWSIECTEHLYEKPTFFRRASAWLQPGGRMAICAWLAGDQLQDSAAKQLVYDVCEGFFCPSLGTMQDYCDWFEQAGLRVRVADDLTANVLRTWEICRRRVERMKIGWLAPLIDSNASLFLRRFDTILAAYRTGAMQYGCFVAEKPVSA